MKNLQKGSMKVILALVIVIVVVVTGYFLIAKKPQNHNEQVINTVQNNNERSNPLAQNIYENAQYGFRVNFPNEYVLFHNPNTGGGPILDGFYFGPKENEIRGPLWGVHIFNSNNVTMSGATFQKGTRTYVLSNEGLNPAAFDQFVSSFMFI